MSRIIRNKLLRDARDPPTITSKIYPGTTVNRYLICAGNDVIVAVSNVRDSTSNCRVAVITNKLDITVVPIGIGKFKHEHITSIVFIAGHFTLSLTNGRMLISTNGVKWVSPHTTRTVTDGTDYSSDLIQYVGDVCFRVHPYDDGAFIQMTDCGIHWSNCSYIDRYDKWCDTIAWNGYEYVLYPKRMSKNSIVYSSIDGRVWRRALTYKVIDRTSKNMAAIVAYGGSHMLDVDDVIRVGKLAGGAFRPVRSENMKDSQIPALCWSAVCYSEQMNSFVLTCNEVCGRTIKIATIEVTDRDYLLRFRMKSPECLRLMSVQSMCNIGDTIAMIANGGRKVVVGDIMTNKWLPMKKFKTSSKNEKVGLTF